MFVHMVSDLHTDIPDTKFMDDTTLVEIKEKTAGSNMQTAADDITNWSQTNQLGLNTSKTKEMRIAFGTSPRIKPLEINNCTIERVVHSKLPGVIIITSYTTREYEFIFFMNGLEEFCLWFRQICR